MSKKKHRTFEDGKIIVRQLERSGLSQERFAEKIGISAAVVGYWVRRLRDLQRKKKKPAVRFVEVVAPRPMSPQSNSVELPGGIMLKTSELPSPQYLAELSAAYQRQSVC
jgi:hypothetical protein